MSLRAWDEADPTDPELTAEELARLRRRYREIIAEHRRDPGPQVPRGDRAAIVAWRAAHDNYLSALERAQ